MTNVEERRSLLGFTVTAPLRRIGGDFEARGGRALLDASIRQIVGTRPHELPYRPFLSLFLEDVRNQNLTEDLLSLAQARVFEAIQTWEPRVQVAGVNVEKEAPKPGAARTALRIRVAWFVGVQGPEGPQTIIPETTTEVTV